MSTFAVFMLIGMGLMFLCMLAANRISYQIPVWKIVISAVLLTAIGLLGAHIMSWIESGKWNGRSFFGAVFLAPLLMWLVAKVLDIRYGSLMDICAPAECIMLGLLKVKCFIDGCCGGRCFTILSRSFQFPSQIVECITAIILMGVLLLMINKKQYAGKIYPSYLILYGIIRFILNLFRETTPWIGPLAAGNFWSLISILIGLAAIRLLRESRES